MGLLDAAQGEMELMERILAKQYSNKIDLSIKTMMSGAILGFLSFSYDLSKSKVSFTGSTNHLSLFYCLHFSQSYQKDISKFSALK